MPEWAQASRHEGCPRDSARSRRRVGACGRYGHAQQCGGTQERTARLRGCAASARRFGEGARCGSEGESAFARYASFGETALAGDVFAWLGRRSRPGRSSREAQAKAGWDAGIRTPITTSREGQGGLDGLGRSSVFNGLRDRPFGGQGFKWVVSGTKFQDSFKIGASSPLRVENTNRYIIRHA